MTVPATAVRPSPALASRPSWPRAAGILVAPTNTMYFVSTGAQIVAGLLIARASIAAAK